MCRILCKVPACALICNVQHDTLYMYVYKSASFHSCPGLGVTYRPDGQELAVASLDGEITFWNPQTAAQAGSIAGRHDLQMGRKETDKITAKQSAKAK